MKDRNKPKGKKIKRSYGILICVVFLTIVEGVAGFGITTSLQFNSLDTTERFMYVTVEDYQAKYNEVSLSEVQQRKLNYYIGEEYEAGDQRALYYVKNKKNLQFIIEKKAENEYVLYKYNSFSTDSNVKTVSTNK